MDSTDGRAPPPDDDVPFDTDIPQPLFPRTPSRDHIAAAGHRVAPLLRAFFFGTLATSVVGITLTLLGVVQSAFGVILIAVVTVSCPGFALAYAICSPSDDGHGGSRLAAWIVVLFAALGLAAIFA